MALKRGGGCRDHIELAVHGTPDTGIAVEQEGDKASAEKNPAQLSLQRKKKCHRRVPLPRALETYSAPAEAGP